MESLTQYQHRLSGFVWDSLPEGDWATALGLKSKVDSEGALKEFVGNTVVFPLREDICAQIQEFTARLYEAVGEYLAEMLPPESYHLTLHDLVAGEPAPEVFARMREVQKRAQSLTAALRARPEQTIRLQSLVTCQLVNTSIVLTFAPRDEAGWRLLQEMHGEYQEIVKLGYPLTLHCTLAYLKPGIISSTAVVEFRRALERLEELGKIDIELSSRDLCFMEFDSMARYREI